MSKLTPNNLTPEQDLLCRDFYEKIAANDSVWPTLGKTQRVVAGALLQILGYSVASGMIVPQGTSLKFAFGSRPDTGEYEGLFDRDRALVEEKLNGTPETTTDAGDTDEAGASESSESDEVGDVLLEDV
jgi:hypothetical protein